MKIFGIGKCLFGFLVICGRKWLEKVGNEKRLDKGGWGRMLSNRGLKEEAAYSNRYSKINKHQQTQILTQNMYPNNNSHNKNTNTYS